MNLKWFWLYRKEPMCFNVFAQQHEGGEHVTAKLGKLIRREFSGILRHSKAPSGADQSLTIAAVTGHSLLELDMPSKYGSASVAAEWTNRHRPTWAVHQHLLSWSTTLLDLQNSTLFPFLFASDGGGGGLPPFGSLMTGFCYAATFNRAKVFPAIVGIMLEVVQLTLGLSEREQLFWLTAGRAAVVGGSTWESFGASHLQAMSEGMSSLDIIRVIHI